ncbi:oligoendopeptidase F [Mycoplasma sp. 2704]|uniref:oligoendopeptidase F n=1 Tax=Mycoplasma sp. 2704 TaxID=3108529 RepID=UPI002B1D4E49|nr:oligoendopeptidase F [Mycoplasma sp. 2704]MEA4134331.1 oligoendopeptidase F [Mycoplasma sp. 2704]
MKAKQYKKYEDVPKKYRWNLEDILQGKKLDDWINEYVALYKERIKNKDSKYDSIEAYLEDLKVSEQLTLISNKVSNYLSNKQNVNLIDPEIIKKSQDVEFLDNQLETEFGSEINRFYANLDKMKVWKDDLRLADYKMQIEETIEQHKHKLSDDVEEYILQTSYGEPDPHNIFSIITNSELDYGYVDLSDKKKIKLNKTNRNQLLKSDKKEVRKQAFEKFWDAYYKHKDSLAETLFQHFKSLTVAAKVRKYPSAVMMLTNSDKVTDEILQTLFDQVASNIKVLAKYSEAYKKFYKAKYKSKMEKWDTLRELVNVKTSYTVEEAVDLVNEAVKPFGEEYANEAKKALTENWVDFMSVQNKRSGAYSIGGTYGIDKKYILMNFDGQLDSVETLAHELGHSMHSYFATKYQPLPLSSYPIFLAEIASIFNESMLYDYLLKTSKNDLFKFEILSKIIQGFIGTVVRQVEWASYEYNLYKGIEEGNVAGSYEAISKLYHENSLKFKYKSKKGKKAKYVAKENLGSIYVPHYYYGFYVYKYAVGQLTANYFFAQYKEKGKEALDNYIHNFLKAGGSDYPLEILKKVGVDLLDKNFYKQSFDYLSDLVNQWIKLGNKIFKLDKK